MSTQNPTVVTDEQIDGQLQDLIKKAEKSDDDLKQIETLKGEKQTRYQKRVDQLTWRAKTAEEQLEEIKAENEKLKTAKPKETLEPVIARKETIKIGDQTFYSDKTLMDMVKNNEIGESEAYIHQQQRVEESAAEKAYQRIKSENQKQTDEKVRADDAKTVLDTYPQFAKDHPSFNPQDPLYKMATELWNEGLASNPRGLSKAVARAKQILRLSDKPIDASDDMSLHHSTPPGQTSEPKEVPLSDGEKEAAIRMYRDENNPATGRNYTESESVLKATKAKNIRLQRRET